MKKPGRTSILRRRAWAHLFIYAVDMGLAISAFLFGFGLQVHSWTALLLVGIVSRWFFHITSSALMFATESERVKEDAEEEAEPA